MAVYFNHLIKRKSTKTQRGSALMLALFVIIVVLLLGLTLVEILSTGNEAVSQEVLGTRAFTAANSGMQAELQKLFPLNNIAGSCAAISNYDFSVVEGLTQCTAVVSCDDYATVDSVTYYRLESTGTCGSGAMAVDSKSIVLSSRTVIVEARSL